MVLSQEWMYSYRASSANTGMVYALRHDYACLEAHIELLLSIYRKVNVIFQEKDVASLHFKFRARKAGSALVDGPSIEAQSKSVDP